MTEEEHLEARNAQIVSMRDAGASWKDITERYGLTRQQARFAYQMGKRNERRRRKSRQISEGP